MTRKKVFVALGAAISVGAIATAGFAFWTTSGDGTSTGQTAAGTSGQLAITSPTVLTDFYPGDAPQDFTVNVKNNSSQSATVTNLKAFITTDAGAGCDGSNFLINGVAAPSTAGTAVALDWAATDLAAGADADTSVDSIQFNNKPLVDQELCKDVDVTINYVAS